MSEGALLVSASQLRALAPDLRPLELASYTSLLHVALSEFGINTPKRIAAFLAQTLHESAGYTLFEERFNYQPERLAGLFPNRVPNVAAAKALVASGPQAVAEAMYGHRTDLGNTLAGDGWKFRGRGVVQITGRENYRHYGPILGLDLESEPDQAALPGVAFRIAAAYWANRGLNVLADHDDFTGITRGINGGLIGFNDRLKRWAEARAVFGIPVAA